MSTMKDFLLINDSGSEVTIDDLGIIIPDSTSVPIFDLGDQFPYYKIYDSDDLRTLLETSVLILNDGSVDLTSSEAVDYLNSVNLYELKRDYYSKLELQTSGLSSVHWDNITNKPADDTVLIDGILYVNDSTRGLFLSVERHSVLFGDSGNVKNRYLSVGTGLVVSFNSGPRLIRNACIVGVSVQLSDIGSCNIQIRKNKVISNIIDIPINAADGYQDGLLNVNVNEEDFLQVYIEAINSVKNPVVILHYAWRI